MVNVGFDENLNISTCLRARYSYYIDLINKSTIDTDKVLLLT